MEDVIGPHEGRELALMLAGRKKLAVFCDSVVEGQQISEDVIPEKAFSLHVDSGFLKRISKDLIHHKHKDKVRYVCYTVRGEEWRAACFFWIKEETYKGRRLPDIADEILIGRLLGYEDEAIDAFIKKLYPHAYCFLSQSLQRLPETPP